MVSRRSDGLAESCAVRELEKGEKCLGEKCLAYVSTAGLWYASERTPLAAQGKAVMIAPCRSLPRSKARSSGAPLFTRVSRA